MSCRAEFRRPCRLGDRLTVDTTIAELGEKTLTLSFHVFNRGELAVRGEEVRFWGTRHASEAGRLVRGAIPPDIAARLASYVAPGRGGPPVAKPRLIETGKPIDEKYGYSPAAVVERAGLVFISGMVGWNADGEIPDDVEAQAQQAFQNLADVLGQLGLDAGDVVMETEYITDLALYPIIGRVRNAFFGAHRPAATLVQVSALFRPGLVFEIQAIAATDQ